jgi:hypothetical protein
LAQVCDLFIGQAAILAQQKNFSFVRGERPQGGTQAFDYARVRYRSSIASLAGRRFFSWARHFSCPRP